MYGQIYIQLYQACLKFDIVRENVVVVRRTADETQISVAENCADKLCERPVTDDAF